MNFPRKMCSWAPLIVAASPLVVMAQFPQQQAPSQRSQSQQGQPNRTQPPSPAGRKAADVVAVVNGDPITEREVHAAVKSRLQGQEVDPQTAQQIQHQVVDGLIESRLIEQYVVKNGPTVEEQEIQTAIKRFEAQLSEQQLTLTQFLADRGHSEKSFQARVEGSIAWQKFQQQQMNEDNLKRYFQKNQERFNSERLDEVRQQVASAYIADMWTTIIREMKPTAKIQKLASPPVQPSQEASQTAPRQTP